MEVTKFEKELAYVEVNALLDRVKNFLASKKPLLFGEFIQFQNKFSDSFCKHISKQRQPKITEFI